MGKAKTFYYLVDNLNRTNAELIKSALKTAPEVEQVIPRIPEGVLEVWATRDVEQQVRMACRVAGTSLRIQVKRKDLP